MQAPPKSPSRPTADTRQPRVLLVDDDPGILKAVARFLAADFEVVDAVTDGRLALEAVPRLDPDVVVLDISMPGLDGLQTAAELRRVRSRAKVVFLTMHLDDDVVVSAITSGALGYVIKTRATLDLIPALHHALEGRQYLPSLAPLAMMDANGHGVLFHGDDSLWLDGVADTLTSGLRRGDIVATVLTASNRNAVAFRIGVRGWNVAELEARGRYLVFDADAAATQLMRDGRLHRPSVIEMVVALESARISSTAGRRSKLTLVGEIASVLCRRGNAEGALELERVWDELTRALPIFTICAYSTACFDDDHAHPLASSIATQHSAISHFGD